MKNNEMPTIVFTGGGTAGPVTPLLAVISVLSELRPEWRFLWIGTNDGPERSLVENSGVSFRAIAAGKLRRYFSWRTFFAPFQIIVGFFQAWSSLGEIKPAAVVSAGGFVAAPVIWAAWLRRVPVHIHQQDIRPTLTNVVTASFAASASVAFEKSLADFRKLNPVLTGNPVRSASLIGSREKAMEVFELEAGLPTVLVVGGGTGAMGLNSLVRKALPLITNTAQVIHVAGHGKTEAVADAGRYHQFEMLIEEYPHALAVADLVVTRAGLGSLSELAVLGKPALVVPMPRSHQEDNAKYFCERSAAVCLNELETFSKQFGDLVSGLLGDRDKLAGLGAEIRKLNSPTAARDVADLVMRLVENKRN